MRTVHKLGLVGLAAVAGSSLLYFGKGGNGESQIIYPGGVEVDAPAYKPAELRDRPSGLTSRTEISYPAEAQPVEPARDEPLDFIDSLTKDENSLFKHFSRDETGRLRLHNSEHFSTVHEGIFSAAGTKTKGELLANYEGEISDDVAHVLSLYGGNATAEEILENYYGAGLPTKERLASVWEKDKKELAEYKVWELVEKRYFDFHGTEGEYAHGDGSPKSMKEFVGEKLWDDVETIFGENSGLREACDNYMAATISFQNSMTENFKPVFSEEQSLQFLTEQNKAESTMTGFFQDKHDEGEGEMFSQMGKEGPFLAFMLDAYGVLVSPKND